MEALDDVLCRLVVAEDGLLFAEDALARCGIVIEDGTWSDEGFVVVAKVRRREFGIRAETGAVSGFVEFDAVRCVERIGFRGSEFERLRKIDYPEMGKAVFALVKREMGLEDVGGGEHDVRTRRDEFAPEFAARIFDWDGHQAERAAEGIGADEEGAAELCVFTG